jgi:hypothetical protein
VFVTAELWTHRLFIRLCAAQNERTRSLDAQSAAEFERFSQEVRATRERGDATRPVPPDQPGEVLSRVPLVVSDDLGTAYRSTGRSAAGTQTEWRGEWHFEPGVPKAASVLTVRLDTPEGNRRARDVPLRDLAVPSHPIDGEHEPAGRARDARTSHGCDVEPWRTGVRVGAHGLQPVIAAHDDRGDRCGRWAACRATAPPIRAGYTLRGAGGGIVAGSSAGACGISLGAFARPASNRLACQDTAARALPGPPHVVVDPNSPRPARVYPFD